MKNLAVQDLTSVLVAALAVAVALAVERGAVTAQSRGAVKPDDNRFTPIVVIPPGELDEPMAFEVLGNGQVYVIERKGALKRYDPTTKDHDAHRDDSGQHEVHERVRRAA